MFALDNTNAVRDNYIAGHSSLAGRVLFTDSPAGTPEAAFMKRNDPPGDIASLVAQGYMVRTRADADTEQARSGDTTQRDAALNSGAPFMASKADSVLGRSVLDFAKAIDKAAGTEYTLGQPSGETEVQVTLNKHKAVSVVVEDIVRAQSSQDVVRRYSEAAAIAIAEHAARESTGKPNRSRKDCPPSFNGAT